jgi:DNA repair protein RadA/Sms
MEDDEDEEDDEDVEVALEEGSPASFVTPPDTTHKFNCTGKGCGYGADEKWIGRCPPHLGGCGGNYRIDEKKNPGRRSATLASLVKRKPKVYVPTGVEEFDRVIGGGLVAGSSILIGGPRGTGKSTLLVKVLDALGQQGVPCLYASGEQSIDDIADIGQRSGALSDNVRILGNEADIEKIVDVAIEMKAKVIVIDSIQKMYKNDCEGRAGSVAQVDASSLWLLSYCKKKKVVSLIVSHVNKAQDFASSEALQHDVDTIVYVEADPARDDDGSVIDETKGVIRLSIYDKNRNGNKHAEVWMEMAEDGSGLRSLSRRLARRYSKLALVEG